MSELFERSRLWRKELEWHGVGSEVQALFNSMLGYMGEQEREVNRLQREIEDMRSVNREGE